MSTHRQVMRDLVRTRIMPRLRPDEDPTPLCRRAAVQMPLPLLHDIATWALVDMCVDRAERKPPVRSANPPADDTELAHTLADIDRRFWGRIDSLVASFKQAVRDEITAELLPQTFTLSSGVEVTWGEATVDQHQAAAANHKGSAVTAMQDAARHEAAIDIITTAGAASLAAVIQPTRKA